jgi:hypothetical protein
MIVSLRVNKQQDAKIQNNFITIIQDKFVKSRAWDHFLRVSQNTIIRFKWRR